MLEQQSARRFIGCAFIYLFPVSEKMEHSSVLPWPRHLCSKLCSRQGNKTYKSIPLITFRWWLRQWCRSAIKRLVFSIYAGAFSAFATSNAAATTFANASSTTKQHCRIVGKLKFYRAVCLWWCGPTDGGGGGNVPDQPMERLCQANWQQLCTCLNCISVITSSAAFFIYVSRKCISNDGEQASNRIRIKIKLILTTFMRRQRCPFKCVRYRRIW